LQQFQLALSTYSKYKGTTWTSPSHCVRHLS